MLVTSSNPKEIAEITSNYIDNNSALISVGEHTDLDINQLIEALNAKKVSFIGGVFPKIIHNNSILDQGIVINTLKDVEAIFLLKNISTKNFTIPKINFDNQSDYSLITYVDGLTSNIANYLGELYENYGMETNYFGGGAGSLSLQQQPCVFNNEGYYQDAAVVCIIKKALSIGVRHGWNKVDGPYIVTKASGNIIKEINWKTPFEIYKSVVEDHSGQTFTDNNFFDIAKGYPFGIVKDNAECIVRDPLSVNEKGELICVGELEDNTLIDILNGDENSLIEAAKKATEDSVNLSKKPSKAIIIDCISRILFLEDNFDKELDVISKTLKDKYPDISIAGALTLGEISSNGNGFLEFYNKTVVVGLFE